MFKLPLLIFLVVGLSFQTFAQNQINKQAEKLTYQLENWYNLETGLWDTTSWWNGANILTALINNAKLNGDDSFKETVAHTFDITKEFKVAGTTEKGAWICKNYINDFYDDEGWWALAWLDAWEYTGEQRYLDMANIIFEDITLGWSEKGGLYWKKGLNYRGSISNGLTLTLATRLHLSGTKDVNGRSALNWATTIWEWMLKSNLLDANGNIQDGVRNIKGEEAISKNVWTYNQGVVLTGLVNLYKITGGETYLKSAESIVEATLNHLTNDNLILVELLCEPDDCNADAKQFKGVFMRHLMYLNQHHPKKEYEFFIRKNIASIWTQSMIYGTISPGVTWDRLSEANAATVSSALDAFNAGLSLQK
ncbi:MAG: glycoside hydrolase family 76 protein [Maribacter sp.]